MALPIYHDYNPSNPWQVTGEQHTITSDGTIRLVYVPFKGSQVGGTNVQISGYTETINAQPGTTEFYIDYQDAAAYRPALGYVQFNVAQAGQTVTVSYYGVSTILWADDINQIQTHINNTAIHPTSGTDIWIGNKTINQEIETTFDNTGQLSTLFSWLAKAIKAITGKTNWYDAPSKNMEELFKQVWCEKTTLSLPGAGYISPIIPLTRNAALDAICFYPMAAPLANTPITVFLGNSKTLTSNISALTTVFTLSSAVTYADPTLILIDSEVMLITSIGENTLTGAQAYSGTTITVTRAQQGTAAKTHLTGSIVSGEIAAIEIDEKTPVMLNNLEVLGTARDMLSYCVGGNGLAATTITIAQEWRNR